MKKVMISLMLVVLIIGLIFQEQAAAQVDVPTSVFGNGGTLISNSNHRIIGTLGQPTIGETSNSFHIMQVGFWFTPNRVTDPEEAISWRRQKLCS